MKQEQDISSLNHASLRGPSVMPYFLIRQTPSKSHISGHSYGLFVCGAEVDRVGGCSDMALSDRQEYHIRARWVRIW